MLTFLTPDTLAAQNHRDSEEMLLAEVDAARGCTPDRNTGIDARDTLYTILLPHGLGLAGLWGAEEQIAKLKARHPLCIAPP